jgi:hypothetical protein
MSGDATANNSLPPLEVGISYQRVVQLILTVYGPYAFGVVSLLIVWYTIVAPQLDRQAIDYEKNERHIEALRGVASSMEAISRSMERTAVVLESVVERMEKSK